MNRKSTVSLVLIALLAWSGSAAGQAPCQSWGSVGGGLTGISIPQAYALEVFDAGSGAALYAAGKFTQAGGTPAMGIARWDGAVWSGLGDLIYQGFPGFGLAIGGSLAVFDDGNGAALYVGGYFTSAGGVPANYIARWDGASWSSLGSGLSGHAMALAVFDDGTGPALYVGGWFQTAGGTSASYLARWSGTSWSSVAGGPGDIVRALAVFDDGTGAALYAGGEFGVKRWNIGSPGNWSSPGGGLCCGLAVDVNALAVHDDGTGPALFAGGTFSSAGSASVTNIAKWNGSAWLPVGAGLPGEVLSLQVYDDGTGPALYAGRGDLAASSHVSRWDGSSWSAVGGWPVSHHMHEVNALGVYDDGSGAALYAGGFFAQAGPSAASAIARWSVTSPIWQVNSAAASLDFDIVQAYCAGPPAVSAHTTAQGMTVSFASIRPVGTPYDVVLNFAPIVGANQPGAFVTPQGQIVNIDLFDPTTVFLSSGSFTPGLLTFPGNLSFPFALPFGATLSAQMVIFDPTQADAFALSQASQADFVACAIDEDFDSATTGYPGIYPAGWIDGGGYYPWNVGSGWTSTSQTGPTGDHTSGSGNYIYCDCPGWPGCDYILKAPPVSVAALSSPTCTFWYHMKGSDIGTLQLQEQSATGWTTLWSLTGAQGNNWQQASVPLTSSGTTALRLQYVSQGYSGDAAIDDFRICE